jgi:hypothetical protein
VVKLARVSGDCLSSYYCWQCKGIHIRTCQFFESNYALDQKKAMGLYFKCGEKYHIGYNKGIHVLNVDLIAEYVVHILILFCFWCPLILNSQPF